MGFADVHIHSVHSYDGTATISGILKYVADETDLDVIAITDHDSISGIQEAQNLGPSYGIEVIPGCEISTAEGHLLALFINKLVPRGLSLIDTVLWVGDLGGICLAAHPMARGVNSLRFENIAAALQHNGVAEILVGIEAFNGGLVYTRGNPSVKSMANLQPLAQVGNSDAHILNMIGSGSSFFPGRTAFDFRKALLEKTTLVREGKGLGALNVLGSYIPNYFLRKLGWVAWNAHPQAPLSYARIK